MTHYNISRSRTLPLPLSPSFQLYGRRAGRLGLYQPLGLAPASHLLRCRDVLSLFDVDEVCVRRVDGPAVSRRRVLGKAKRDFIADRQFNGPSIVGGS